MWRKSGMPDELTQNIEIYVPSQCRCGKPLPEDIRAEALEDVKSTMAAWFGGGSVRKADIRVEQIEGFWPLATGETANEQVDVVYSNSTEDALAEHFKEIVSFTAGLANRLTQEAVAFRVDGKMTLMPGEDLKPHRCAGGVSTGELPTPLQPDEKARLRALQASLQRISSVRDARDLFCNVLHYEFEDEQLSTVGWPDKLRESLAPGTSPRIIADQNGFKICYLQLADDYLRKGSERQLVQRIIKDDPTMRGLLAISDIDQKQWHLVNAKFEKEEGERVRLRIRRMRVGAGQSVRTAVERLAMVDIEFVGEDTSAAGLQDLHDRAFDVESVSKEFFNEISNWYFWALSHVEFPNSALAESDGEKHRATSLIRFLTRIVFCWFLKEKGLIPESLFREKDVANILVNLDPDACTYHQGILQNLFFATLNQRMGKDSKGKPWRAFATDADTLKPESTSGIDTVYRYEEHFRDPGNALKHFADVPFLNGGLFECLDRTDENTGKKLYVDGFSRNKEKRARVPNRLFFSGEQTIDLSKAYGDTRRCNAQVRGLLQILHSYNFTIEENTPIDEEIALDPELLGKVFENLLASYNEETKTTARKQTGSFYTPRPIVEYMVDESLKAYLSGALSNLEWQEQKAHEQLDLLLGYTDEESSFSEKEVNALLQAIHTCKILDPACGSGAFPIGMLQKLVHIVHKLDPGNVRWKQLQIGEASKIPDPTSREAAIKAIRRDFEDNGDDYGRKLYLIESCLYGVDIQPIAVQISKLRFFISLICDQKTSRDKAKNHGIRALPNLETKFVAANTLVKLNRDKQLALDLFANPMLQTIESELQGVRHAYFSAQTRKRKLALQKNDSDLRAKLSDELRQTSFADQTMSEWLATWDPYDAQHAAPFFDPLWMFDKSLADGFDVVLGNPPYYKENDDKRRFDGLRDLSCYLGKMDVWYLFVDIGLDLLKPNGTLAFIATNNWVTNAGAQKLRNKILSEASIDSFIDFFDHMVFKSSSVQTMVMLLTKRREPATFNTFVARAKDDLVEEDLRHLSLLRAGGVAAMEMFTVAITRSDWINKTLVFNTGKNNNLLEQIKRQGATYLMKREIAQGIVPNPDKVNSRNIKRFAKSAIATRGIAVGDGVFVLTNREQDQIAKDERQYLRPLYEPTHIGNYRLEKTNMRILYTKAGSFDPKKNPSIVAHLKRFREVMEERRENKAGRIAFYNLHWPRAEDTFEPGEKILAPRKCDTPTFCYTTERAYVMLAVNVIRTSRLDMRYLSGLLNSSTIRFWLRHMGKMQGANFQVDAEPLQQIPLAVPNKEVQRTIGTLVDFLQLESAVPSAIARSLVELVDACVMECYFFEHMERRGMLIIDELTAYLSDYDSGGSKEQQRVFLEKLHREFSENRSKIGGRLERIGKESPDLLAIIQQ